MFDKQLLRQIRESYPLSEVARTHLPTLVPLSGGRFKAHCPFHEERTGSFVVNDPQGYYYCFGCHTKGDHFDLYQHLHRCDFNTAVKAIAELAGVTVVDNTEQQQLFKELASHWNRQHTPESLAYLSGRGISPATTEAFSVGYSSSGSATMHFLRQSGLWEVAEQNGLVKQFEGQWRCALKYRIILPLYHKGEVVGFIGRDTTGKSKARYLNFPKGVTKSNYLYGFDLLDPTSKSAVLVEGPFDCLALHSAGVQNPVAILGSSLSKDQASLLAEVGVRTCKLLYDGDVAGRACAAQSAQLLSHRMIRAEVVDLPEGYDPAQFVVEYGPVSTRNLFTTTRTDTAVRNLQLELAQAEKVNDWAKIKELVEKIQNLAKNFSATK